MDGGFRLLPLDVLGTDVVLLSEVFNSTCWNFDDFAGGETDGSLIFEMVEVGHVYLFLVKFGIGIDIGGCLSSSPMFTSFISSASLYEHEKL